MTRVCSGLCRDLAAHLQGVFQKPTPNNPQALLRNREYDNTASTSCFVAEPSAVHFAGAQRGKRHVRGVRIINRSGYLAGLHVLPCEGSTFQARLANKRGAVAPGLAEVVHVECRPEKEQYYQGAVRIHCGVRPCLRRVQSTSCAAAKLSLSSPSTAIEVASMQ